MQEVISPYARDDQSEIRVDGEQLVEHLICNQGVGGSNPSTGTNKINGLGGNT